MKIKYCDALVVGGGLAGLRTAIATANEGLETTVISLVPVKRSHSAAAQGGMQASLGNSKMSEGDNEDVHFEDTVKGSDWGCDQEVARMFVQTAPKAIRELAGWGVPWTRINKGNRQAIINSEKTTITEKDDRHGLIHSRDFGGTKKWRTCYTADATGHTMLYSVANEALKKDVNIEDRKEAISVIHHNSRCYGVVVRDLVNGDIIAYIAKATMIATGGYGRLYQNTTNAVICEGIGAAIALETGLAGLGNMEAVQFHPTPIVPSGILLTEGCRGDGGLLRDVDGYRFMPDYEPDKKELASRDVVSRRMMEHIRSGKGVKSPYGEHLWLDIAILGREHIETNLRDIQDICKSFNGIDPADEGKKGWAPVRPMQHYSMGGIRTDKNGEVKNLKGLFASGEVACWDLHGFNRLGGNSVAEAVVAGMIIGGYFRDFAMNNDIDISTKQIQVQLQKQQDYIDSLINSNGKEDIFAIKDRMKNIMDDKVGIFRTKKELGEAVKELEELYKKSLNANVINKKHTMNPILEEAYRVPKMLKLALCVTQGALAREESRGAHFREDFPKRDDEKWLKRTIAKWTNQKDTMPTLSYETLDISKMEMAPAFRGYGKKDSIINHSDTQKREKEIQQIKKDNPNANRHEMQELLMPYALQEEYKTKNQRAGVDYE